LRVETSGGSYGFAGHLGRACRAIFRSPAAAQTAVSAAEAARTAEDDRVVCNSQKSTGTRLGKKICMTQRQRDEMREQQMRDLKEATGPGIQSDSDSPGAPN
jgi:hypothetical protein